MALTVRSLLLLVAVVLFVLDAFASVAGIALTPLGLAAFAGSFVAPDRRINSRV